MQKDFHYYATYCAAFIAGYSHEDSLKIGYGAQFVDWCTKTLLTKIGAPLSAATTQLQLEMMDMKTDTVGIQEITRIWSSFHFLPYDLYAEKKGCFKRYKNKFRLICNTNGSLLRDTVGLAKGKGCEAAGIAMHVLADTWAHRYFAGTPSLVINNTDSYFYEIFTDGADTRDKKIEFRHNPFAGDDLDESVYVNSLYQSSEKSIMNLGHGRAGHLPDYSFIRYKYMPAWGGYAEIIKDNPSDYYNAFCQMVYALKYLRGINETFETDTYDTAAVSEWEDEIKAILIKRQPEEGACRDWKEFGEKLSGCVIDDFDIERYQQEYIEASEEQKDATYLGRFFLSALAHKSMITNKIYTSGNKLAGISVDYDKKGFKGIKDFKMLVDASAEEGKNE